MKAGEADEAEKKKNEVQSINKIAGSAEEDLNEVNLLWCPFLASSSAYLVRVYFMIRRDAKRLAWMRKCRRNCSTRACHTKAIQVVCAGGTNL